MSAIETLYVDLQTFYMRAALNAIPVSLRVVVSHDR